MRTILPLLSLALATGTITAQTATPPPPPTTLTELKKNSGGLEQVTGDLRESYGDFPVSAVYKRVTERVTVSYLVNGESVFGYRFVFTQPGSDTQLWRDGTDQFVASTFPKEIYRCEGGSSHSANGAYYRIFDVLNEKAYEEAKKAYAAAETIRLQEQSFGNTNPPVEKTDDLPPTPKPEATDEHKPISLADYQKRFPDTVAATVNRGNVPGFEYMSIDDLAVDGYNLRQTGDISVLILSNRGTIIGYVVKVRSPLTNITIWQRTMEASLKATFPDSAYTRLHTGATQPFYFYRIVDKAAAKAASDTYFAEESARLKALLAP